MVRGVSQYQSYFMTVLRLSQFVSRFVTFMLFSSSIETVKVMQGDDKEIDRNKEHSAALKTW